MLMNNHISVVLAVYNGEKYLKKLLDSLLAQVNVHIAELIVIDDCSTDDSYNMILAYGRKINLRLIKNDANMGPVASFVKGARLAVAEYIAFADQDDVWLENKLSLSLKLISEVNISNKPAVVFHDLKMIDENDKDLNNSFWDLYNIRPFKNNFFTLLFGNVITGCTMLINRPMLKEFINMPLNVEMHDHWVALIASSFGCWKYSDEKMVLYRVHQQSVTLKNKNDRTLKDVLRYFLSVSLNKDSAYLNNYINQAILFKQHYQSRLDVHTNAQLDYFINLEKSSGLFKLLIAKYRFIFKRYLEWKLSLNSLFKKNA
jgi:glycosyltransferase involved in cell wall biosynthesis